MTKIYIPNILPLEESNRFTSQTKTLHKKKKNPDTHLLSMILIRWHCKIFNTQEPRKNYLIWRCLNDAGRTRKSD